MVAHLVWLDVKHNLRPIRALPPLLLGLWLTYNYLHRPWAERVAHVQGTLTLASDWIFPKIIPIIAAVMSGNLAAERRSGITLSLLAKGVRRRDYVASRLMGAAISSATVTAAIIVGLFAIAMILWPWDRVTVPGDDVFPGPLPQLYAENPLANDLVIIPMLLAAAAALPSIGILTGLVIANEYVAMAMTPIVLILWIVMMPRGYDLLDPAEYLWLGYFTALGPHFRWLIPFAPFLFWGTFVSIIYFICQRIFAKKEFV